jgi:hypothetical protein
MSWAETTLKHEHQRLAMRAEDQIWPLAAQSRMATGFV